MIIYLAGPISLNGTSSDDEIAAFVSAFNDWESYLHVRHHEVFNPCSLHDGQHHSWEWYMKRTIPMLLQSEVMAVLPRWRESRGAMLEAFIASQLLIPVRDVEEFA